MLHHVSDLWQCYITFPALSGNVTPRFRSLAMLHNVSDLWQSWLCALEVIKRFPCVMHEFKYFDASYWVLPAMSTLFSLSWHFAYCPITPETEVNDDFNHLHILNNIAESIPK
jgi:hypothetical protein